MPRIAKSAVKAVLAETGDRLLQAAGTDGIVSRKDAKKAAEGAGSEKETALTRVFYGFIDHRDFKAGARVTGADVRRAIEYAGAKMVDRLDVNNNGLSKAELKEGSTTVKLAAAILAERIAAKKAASGEAEAPSATQSVE